jgi:hypothetical protein
MRAILFAGTLFAAIIATCAPEAAHAEPARPLLEPGKVLALRNLMKPDEFRAAGLDRLSRQELSTLDDWVGRLAVRLLTVRTRAGCSSPVDSRIDGDFEGWDGGTLFELENGQVWMQRGTARQHTYRFSPRVRIHRSTSGCAMTVDGVGEVLVERLR